MTKHFSLSLALALLAFGSATPVHAHLFWIEPNEFFHYAATKEQDAKVQEMVSADFVGGDTYFNANLGVDMQKLEGAVLSLSGPDGKKIQPVNSFIGETRIVFEAPLEKSGTYLLQAATGQTPVKCFGDKPEVMCAYIYAKSYVTLHTPSDTWQKPTGHTLEIVPLDHPNAVYADDTLKVKVLYEGAPLPDAIVKAIPQNYRMKEHGDAPLTATTDGSGVAALSFPAATRWLVSVGHEVSSQAADVKTDYHGASLMLAVEEPWVEKLAAE